MKYKNIKSMLHNYAHSFFSLMNYFDDQYIIDLVGPLLHEVDGHQISIRFPSGEITPEVACPEALRKSVAYHVEWLPRHAASHDVQIDRVSRIQLSARGTRLGIEYSVQARDDRGSEYDIPVRPGA